MCFVQKFSVVGYDLWVVVELFVIFASTTGKCNLGADHVHIVVGLHDTLDTSQWQVIMRFKV